MRFSIEEYAKHFKMSKEMVYSKIRANRLAYIIEDNTTYIIVSSNEAHENRAKEATQTISTIQNRPVEIKKKLTVGTIISLYQKENIQLKNRIKELEDKIDRLISDKENMFQAERERIERVYIAKDDQLKSILDLVNTKLQLSKHETIHDVYIEDSSKNVDIVEKKDNNREEDFIELNRYLRLIDIDSKYKKKIYKRFEHAYGKDIRIIEQNGLFFLDFSKYDYSDLLKR